MPHAIPAADVVSPVVPLFHACGWATPNTAPINGAKPVLRGARLDGASLYELFEAERATLSLGVSTIWRGFAEHLDVTGARCTTLRSVLSGGAAVPPL